MQYIKVQLDFTLVRQNRSIIDTYNDLTHIAYTLNANQVMETTVGGAGDMSDLRLIRGMESEVLFGFYAIATKARKDVTLVRPNDQDMVERLPAYIREVQPDTIDVPRFDPVSRTVRAELLVVTPRVFLEDSIAEAMTHYRDAIQNAIGADVTWRVVFDRSAEAPKPPAWMMGR